MPDNPDPKKQAQTKSDLDKRQQEYVEKLKQHGLLEVNSIYDVLLLFFKGRADLICAVADLEADNIDGTTQKYCELFETPFTLNQLGRLSLLKEEYLDVVLRDPLEIMKLEEEEKAELEHCSFKRFKKTPLNSQLSEFYKEILKIAKGPKRDISNDPGVLCELNKLFLYFIGGLEGETINEITVWFRQPLLDHYFQLYPKYPDTGSVKKHALICAQAMRKLCDPLSDEIMDILRADPKDLNAAISKEATEKYLCKLRHSVGDGKLIGKPGPKTRKS